MILFYLVAIDVVVVLRSVQTMHFCSLGQGTVSPWSIVPRCLRVLQVLPTMSDSSQVSQLLHSRYPTLLEALATPWDSVEQCSMGTLSLVPRSKVASSGPTLACMCGVFFLLSRHTCMPSDCNKAIARTISLIANYFATHCHFLRYFLV